MTDTPDTKKKKKTDAEKLAALKQQEAQLKARIARLEAKEKTEEHKKDTRRKIIIGAAVMAHAALEPIFAAELRCILKQAVTRESDRDTIKDFLG